MERISSLNRSNLEYIEPEEEEIFSTVIINFNKNEKDQENIKTNLKITQPIILQMKCIAIEPRISFSTSSINFCECKLNNEKLYDITITNAISDKPIDFQIKKIPSFSVFPSSGIIKEFIILTVKFIPDRLGVFDSNIEFRYNNDSDVFKYLAKSYLIIISLNDLLNGPAYETNAEAKSTSPTITFNC